MEILLLLFAFAATGCRGLAMSPQARLHVVARGAVPFGQIQSQIQEVTDALARLTKRNTCSEEDGCLLVEINWAPADKSDCPTSMQMSLIMAPPEPVKTVRKSILSDRVNIAKPFKEARDVVERVMEEDA